MFSVRRPIDTAGLWSHPPTSPPGRTHDRRQIATPQRHVRNWGWRPYPGAATWTHHSPSHPRLAGRLRRAQPEPGNPVENET